MAKSLRLVFWSLSVVLFLFPGRSAVDAEDSLAPVVLRNEEVTESSGLTFSHRRPDRIWTHNDSGDGARIFAFDLQGNPTGEYELAGLQAVDWEDTASFVIDDQSRLLVADVGDNLRRRDHVTVHLFDEPDPDSSGAIARPQTITFRYPEGPQDCEAVAVDTQRRQILLATKEFLPTARVYALPLDDIDMPQRSAASDGDQEPPMTQAEYLFRLPMPLITAMDLSSDSGSLLLCGYFDLFIYRLTDTAKGWRSLLETKPSHQVLPRLPQIEGACFDPQGRVWVSSEGRPGNLMQLPRAGDER